MVGMWWSMNLFGFKPAVQLVGLYNHKGYWRISLFMEPKIKRYYNLSFGFIKFLLHMFLTLCNQAEIILNVASYWTKKTVSQSCSLLQSMSCICLCIKKNRSFSYQLSTFQQQEPRNSENNKFLKRMK